MKSIFCLGIGMCALGLAGHGLAAPLAPGGVVATDGYTASSSPSDPVARPELAGLVQNDNILQFLFNPTPASPFTQVAGEVRNNVLQSDLLNTLIFGPRIRNLANFDGGTAAILGFRLNGYAGVNVDVNYRLDGVGDKGFSSVSRSVDGDVMTFLFDDPIFADSMSPPGLVEESYFPSIVTDATEFDTSGTMTIFAEILQPVGSRTPTGDDANLITFDVQGIAAPTRVPVEVVPVSASLFMLGTGLFAFGFLRRKRKRRSRRYG